MPETDLLGAKISEHKGRFSAGGVAWYIGGIIFVMALYGMGNEVISGHWANIPFFLLVLVGSGFWLFYNYTRWKQKITLHANGFIWNRIVRKPLIVNWSDIAAVEVTRTTSRQSMHTKGVDVRVLLELRDGSHVVVSNDMEGIEEIASYADVPANPEQSSPPASPWG